MGAGGEVNFYGGEFIRPLFVLFFDMSGGVVDGDGSFVEPVVCTLFARFRATTEEAVGVDQFVESERARIGGVCDCE